MKDECRGKAINEVIAVRPKMYSVLSKKKKEGEGSEKKKCD